MAKVQTLIKLLLYKEQSDLGLHCLSRLILQNIYPKHVTLLVYSITLLYSIWNVYTQYATTAQCGSNRTRRKFSLICRLHHALWARAARKFSML